jgi:hypothetical protein
VREGTTKLELDSLDASVAFEGPVRTVPRRHAAGHGTKGLARFRRDGVDVTVESGRCEGLAVGPGRVEVAWPAESTRPLETSTRAAAAAPRP